MKLLKKINLINSHEIIVLFPHASSYAEQLLVNKSHKSIYGVVYPSCKINFKELCIYIASDINQLEFKKLNFIGSSMGGYICFLVAFFLEKEFGVIVDMLHIFSVDDPDKLILKLKDLAIDAPVSENEKYILSTIDINHKRISSIINIYYGNDPYIDIEIAKTFWENSSLNRVIFTMTRDGHLPSSKTLSEILEYF